MDIQGKIRVQDNSENTYISGEELTGGCGEGERNPGVQASPRPIPPDSLEVRFEL